MSKRVKDLGTSIDLKFDTEKIKTQAYEILNADSNERKIFMKYKKTKITLIIAAIIILCVATAFATEGVISYFSSNKSAEVTNVEELQKHNEEINKSVSKYGYTLTLDNIAADDNFLHVFYTITSIDGKISENKNIDPFVSCRINGRIIDGETNRSMHGYYADDYTYKTVVKYNISKANVPEKFLFEIYSVPRVDLCSDYSDDYLNNEYLEFTEEDKEKLMYISTETKKSTIETDSVIYDLNQTFVYTDYNGNDISGEITKVVFSPFGNQFVVHDRQGGLSAEKIMGMAMLDDDNNFLDVLSSDIGGGDESFLEQDNSVEFMKGGSDMKYFTLVPIKPFSENKSDIRKKVDSYPLTFEINRYGKVVVTGISIKDGRLDVHYYKDGFVRFNPEFIFLDENSNDIKFGDIPAVYYEVHHDTNSYTASYYYDDYDENGKKLLPLDGSLSEENLKNRFVELEVKVDNSYMLDYDNAIKVNLE